MGSSTERAWAAGFYDGEGSTGVTSRTSGRYTYRYLQVSVAQKDRRPLDRFVAAIGPANVRGPYTGKQKLGGPTYQVTYTGSRAEDAIALLWPYLSEPKREQIERKREEVGRSARDTAV